MAIPRILFGLILCVTLLLAGCANQNQDDAPKPVLSKAKRQPLQQVVSATGRVIPNFEVEIKGKASGKIIHLPYDVSDHVRQGQLLAQLDPVDEVRQVNQASANLSALQSRVGQSQLEYNAARATLATERQRAEANVTAARVKAEEARRQEARLKQLLANRFISQQEYDAGLSTAAQAIADLQNAQVRLQELNTEVISLGARAKAVQIAGAEASANRQALMTAQQRLSETKIYAPISGVITSRPVQIGQIIASGINNVSGGTTLMTLADLSNIFILAAVDESDIGRVREGQAVNITADAFPKEKFTGRVVRVASKGVNQSNVVTFEVKILVTSSNAGLLKPEMTANVNIVTAQKDNALVVPAEAIQFQRGKPVLDVKKGEQTVRRPVEVGIQTDTQTEITSGLRPGETVLVPQGPPPSRWRKEGDSGAGNRRAQRAMMSGMGRRR